MGCRRPRASLSASSAVGASYSHKSGSNAGALQCDLPDSRNADQTVAAEVLFPFAGMDVVKLRRCVRIWKTGWWEMGWGRTTRSRAMQRNAGAVSTERSGRKQRTEHRRTIQYCTPYCTVAERHLYQRNSPIDFSLPHGLRCRRFRPRDAAWLKLLLAETGVQQPDATLNRFSEDIASATN
ncbi:hypothetical protein BJ875DRAFT_87254 [Amylocarpus encephaloides]|uniref:Uncharacterized protein n=1 Tax=Amylocarpus encephaloides TaxID=45428 RepID=A0A9P7YR29_9HELO|nr:hypothetical protein BJ875DRAFT_87254 [Amylocarpus encephaloides]